LASRNIGLFIVAAPNQQIPATIVDVEEIEALWVSAQHQNGAERAGAVV
jgi:CMP-2-keto-3-deoxyoctulosonic acid synthetase